MKHAISILLIAFDTILLAPIATGSHTQPYIGAQSKLEFEAATIKPVDPSASGGVFMGGGCHGSDSRYNSGSSAPPPLARCVLRYTLLGLIATASPQPTLDGAGDGPLKFEGPSWANSDRWDVEAKAEDPNVSEAELRQMLFTLLTDRFKLQFHHETRQVQGYELTIARNGPKIQEDASDVKPGMSVGTGLATFTKCPVRLLATFLAGNLDGPVVDTTGLTGAYSFKFNIPPRPTASGDGTLDSPSIFTALQEQLGFRLAAQKIPQDVTVIDHAEKPSPN